VVVDDKFFITGRLIVVALNAGTSIPPGLLFIDYSIDLITPVM
jgi:hypothetical protein